MNFAMLREIVALRRRSLSLLAFLVLADLAIFGYLSWQKPELERVQTEWFAKRDAAAKGEDRGEAARYREAERDLKAFDGRIIEKKNFAEFLNDLFSLAKSNSLTIKGVSYKPQAVKGEPLLMTYSIGFDVTGKYGKVKSFLSDLVRLPKMVTVDSVALGNPSQTEESVNLKVQMTVYLKTEGA